MYQLFATSCRLAYINVSDAADSQHAREVTNDSCQIKYALRYAVDMARNSIFLPVSFAPV